MATKKEYIKVKPLVEKVDKLATIRKAIARNLRNVTDNVAYCSLVNKVDATALWNYRSKVKDDVLKKQGVKLTFLSWIIKAVTIALSEHPMFSAQVNADSGEVHFPGTLNIGMAVDTPFGLVVPVIKNAEKLSIVEIQKEIIRLSTLARDRKLTMADMSGACFTITNVGSVGVLFGSPIMNPVMNKPGIASEMAILGTGAIIDEVQVKDGKMVSGKAMYLSIAADHRWVDGGDMGRFNYRIKELLEDPEKLGEL